MAIRPFFKLKWFAIRSWRSLTKPEYRWKHLLSEEDD